MKTLEIGVSTSGNKSLDKNFFDYCQKYDIKYVEISPPFNYQGKDIINEATMVINNYSNEGSSSKSSSKKISRVLWFFIGFVLSFVITLSVYLLFL